jgi:hypothetical protein
MNLVWKYVAKCCRPKFLFFGQRVLDAIGTIQQCWVQYLGLHYFSKNRARDYSAENLGALRVMPLMLVQTDSAELETEVTSTPNPQCPDVGVLLLHPYSGLGGSMDDFVIREFHR